MIDPKIFEDLQQKVDEEIEVGDNLFKIVLRLNRDVAVTQGRLCRIHSTPRAKRKWPRCAHLGLSFLVIDICCKVPALLAQVEESIRAETRTLQELAAYASNYPFYK